VDDLESMCRHRPHVFFDGHCPPCIWMSRAAVRLSLGSIVRVPLQSDAARRFYDRYPQERGQIVLLYRDHMSFGRPVFASLPRVVVTHWLHVVADLVRFLPLGSGSRRA
jgi:predicted DCC family thiol-disulfide oxidoreductase YuxK